MANKKSTVSRQCFFGCYIPDPGDPGAGRIGSGSSLLNVRLARVSSSNGSHICLGVIPKGRAFISITDAIISHLLSLLNCEEYSSPQISVMPQLVQIRVVIVSEGSPL